MRRTNRCPRCLKRTAQTTAKCVGCGSRVERIAPFHRSGRKGYFLGFFSALTLVAVAAVNYADRYIPAISDWYLEMVVPMESTESRFMDERVEEEAYTACARTAVRKLEDSRSIATFGGREHARAVSLEDGRVEIESYLDEFGDEGTVVRRPFSCSVRYDGKLWRVETLTVRDAADPRVIPVNGPPARPGGRVERGA